MRALALALLLGALPALAPAAEAPAPRRAELAQVQGQDDGAPADDAPRRRPGRAPEADRVAPAMDPNAVPPPLPTVPREFIPLPDRWRLTDALGITHGRERPYDPYNPNVLKADRPIFGNEYFLNFEAISDTLFEPRRVPTPTAFATNVTPGTLNTFGRPYQSVFNQRFLATFSLIKGNTAYKPPDFELRLTPAFNYQSAHAEERGVLNVNPARGTERDVTFGSLQEAFFDYHLRNVSDRYDFDSVRAGIQPFSSDFRGFLFQDVQLGFRLFGNRDNNRWQYNLAYFRRLEKDTNSGLNDLGQPLRRDDIFIANLYRQDLPVVGFTSQVIFARNSNREANDQHYDRNGFLVRPSILGDQRGANYDVNYLGYNGDGHFGRFNLTTSFYFAFGETEHNPFLGTRSSSQDIRAFFAAAEPSIDFDWVRIRLSGLYASGDSKPTDRTATGFDAIRENPIFAGADTSYWIRQGIPLIGGGGVALSGRNGVLPSLRSSIDEGQSNFVNPGLFLAGVGADLDLTPELRLSTNLNYLAFAETAPLELLRQQGGIRNEIGYDLSAALSYRPLFSNNIVMRLSGAILFPGDGLKDLYNVSGASNLFGGDRYLYSVLANLILTY
ncbi:MAG: hypothetical protein HY060_23550 [Proteobacteria bacterium]|nr:hypothetical protein [Pseudomonadota bacterium]